MNGTRNHIKITGAPRTVIVSCLWKLLSTTT